MTRDLAVITVSMVCMGFFMAGIYPTTVANLGTIVRDEPMAIGFLMVIGGSSSIIMPLIMGAVSEKAGITGGMSTIVVTVVIMVGFAVYNVLRQREKGAAGLPER